MNNHETLGNNVCRIILFLVLLNVCTVNYSMSWGISRPEPTSHAMKGKEDETDDACLLVKLHTGGLLTSFGKINKWQLMMHKLRAEYSPNSVSFYALVTKKGFITYEQWHELRKKALGTICYFTYNVPDEKWNNISEEELLAQIELRGHKFNQKTMKFL